ncbi:NADPH-dependent FMN reductase [Ornithinibacillus xuwenensis]|uniref:NADPH-dependent FMN reductase n=1 Tax=Ornithinibacillus xuwenensis TaxID=3144668 RepID=A0ABU9XFD6_9BACI
MKIIGISGSIVGSKTRVAVELALQYIQNKQKDIDIELIDLSDYNLVFCDGRDYHDYSGDTKIVLEKILSADAFIIGTPTFQASIPGTLKNLFDLLPRDAFCEKAISILVTAGTPKHFLVAEQQLKPILDYMQAVVIPKYVFIEGKHFDQKVIVDEGILKRIDRLTQDTINWAKALEEMKNPIASTL